MVTHSGTSKLLTAVVANHTQHFLSLGMELGGGPFERRCLSLVRQHLAA